MNGRFPTEPPHAYRFEPASPLSHCHVFIVQTCKAFPRVPIDSHRFSTPQISGVSKGTSPTRMPSSGSEKGHDTRRTTCSPSPHEHQQRTLAPRGGEETCSCDGAPLEACCAPRDGAPLKGVLRAAMEHRSRACCAPAALSSALHRRVTPFR